MDALEHSLGFGNFSCVAFISCPFKGVKLGTGRLQWPWACLRRLVELKMVEKTKGVFYL